MNLGQFEQHIKSFPEGTIFKYGISEPFSWRGVYAEVAFQMLEESMTREQILERIQEAYNGIFVGYKGGEYRYCETTDVNFECDYGRYTDGGYTSQWIAKLEETEPYQSQEERLVKLAFSNR